MSDEGADDAVDSGEARLALRLDDELQRLGAELLVPLDMASEIRAALCEAVVLVASCLALLARRWLTTTIPVVCGRLHAACEKEA